MWRSTFALGIQGSAHRGVFNEKGNCSGMAARAAALLGMGGQGRRPRGAAKGGGGRGRQGREQEPPAAGGARRDEHGQRLREFLVKEYMHGTLPAKTVCSIAWLATQAGAHGVADLGMPPEDRGENFSRHLRTALGHRPTMYVGKVPIFDRSTNGRAMIDFPIRAPHEEFAAAFRATPRDFNVALLSDADLSGLPSAWHAHPVTLAKGTKSVPIGYFSDAVPHTHRGGFFAFYWTSLLSKKRYLICTIRKSDLCQCGCRGQCTFGAVFNMLTWSFNALASGEYPSQRHDNAPLDEQRARIAGQELADGFCGAFSEMRADLLEFVGALGFRNWSDVRKPCFLCNATKTKLFEFPASVEATTWELATATSYAASVAKVFVRVRVEHMPTLRLFQEDLTFVSPKGVAGSALS